MALGPKNEFVTGALVSVGFGLSKTATQEKKENQ